MASGTLILPLVLAVVLVSFVIAALLAYRSVRQRRDRLAKQRELEQYENALQMDRAQRALQRAREVLAERTGNAGWNPQLEQRVRSMQLETKTAPSLGDDSTGGLVSPSGDPVKVSERAMQLVIEYGAQGAMMQVMHAAKKQLDKEYFSCRHKKRKVCTMCLITVVFDINGCPVAPDKYIVLTGQ